MKKTVHTIMLLFLVISITFSASCSKSKVLAKIDDKTITLEEFNTYYYANNKLTMNKEKNEEIDKLAKEKRYQKHPTLNKSLFLDFLISRKLILEKASADKDIDQQTLATIKKLASYQGYFSVYIQHKTKGEILATDKEIQTYYENYKRYTKKNIPLSPALIAQIKQQIQMRKTQESSRILVMNLVAESKVNKEGFQELLKKLTEDTSKTLNIDIASENVLVTIDDYKITNKEFFDYVITQNMISRGLTRKEAAEYTQKNKNPKMLTVLLENLVSFVLVTQKAQTEKEIDQKDLKAVVDLSVMQGVAQFYLTKKVAKDIKISDKEIDAYYKANLDRLKGVPVTDEVMQQLKNEIKMKKLETLSTQYVLKLVEENSVNKDGFVEYLKEENAEDNKDEKKEEKKDNK